MRRGWRSHKSRRKGRPDESFALEIVLVVACSLQTTPKISSFRPKPLALLRVAQRRNPFLYPCRFFTHRAPCSCCCLFFSTSHKPSGAPSIALLRWVGMDQLPPPALVAAFVCHLHPERNRKGKESASSTHGLWLQQREKISSPQTVCVLPFIYPKDDPS